MIEEGSGWRRWKGNLKSFGFVLQSQWLWKTGFSITARHNVRHSLTCQDAPSSVWEGGNGCPVVYEQSAERWGPWSADRRYLELEKVINLQIVNKNCWNLRTCNVQNLRVSARREHATRENPEPRFNQVANGIDISVSVNRPFPWSGVNWAGKKEWKKVPYLGSKHLSGCWLQSEPRQPDLKGSENVKAQVQDERMTYRCLFLLDLSTRPREWVC